ncbi:unnamed protein product [Mytilus coruscus]|uniref:Reverse transcriptase domain-containing protein n=1 Tax=Mytilus coruscus TaxID=42192 RepID=A0A6J8A6I7_MYTCO|nr:unnamed protein product [Mytilus coruscus]
MNVKSKPTYKAIKSGYISKFKIQWKDIDSKLYHNHISNELSQHNIESHSIEESINFLCNCLKKAATVAVPSKIIKLKGPQFKASPTTLMLLKISKEKYQLWKSNGKKNDHLKTDKILAQRNLRKQLRKEHNEPQFSFQNICDAIQQLHSGKATDELGLAAEHLKNSPTTVTHFLTNCFNNIFNNHHIPDIFKSGIVTPVLKKGKNPMLMDNYRGIAVTPVISKLFECTILPRLTVNFNQSPLQFGFTKGLLMLMASLIITEARAEVKQVTMELFISYYCGQSEGLRRGRSHHTTRCVI